MQHGTRTILAKLPPLRVMLNCSLPHKIGISVVFSRTLTCDGTVEFIFTENQGVMGYCTRVELTSPHYLPLACLVLFMVTLDKYIST